MKTIWERFTDGFTLKKITWIVLGSDTGYFLLSACLQIFGR